MRKVEFKDLFHKDTKEQAVICYLSLERRFLEVSQELRELKAYVNKDYVPRLGSKVS